MVFSAHGVSSVHAEANRGLKVIDATCPLVTKVHQEARKFAAKGYDIVLVGHEGHEEVAGTMGHAPWPSTSSATRTRRPGSRSPTRAGRLPHPDHPVGRRDRPG